MSRDDVGTSGTWGDLLRPSSIPGIRVPRYDGRSIVNLSVSAFLAAGGEPEGEAPLAPPLSASLDPFHGRRSEGTVVVLLVDGLGFDALDRWSRGPSARGRVWGALSEPMTTVFPSTTTAALTSLSTGVPPGRHGLVGYRQYLPAYGVVADLLKMSPTGLPTRDLLIGPDWQPSMLSNVPSLFRRGVRGAAVTRDLFRGTGFTRLLYDAAEFVGYSTGTDLAHELGRVLSRNRPPALVLAYWDELDTIQHLQGPVEALTELELERIAHLVEHVARVLPPRRRRSTTLLVTGDHGQVTSTIAARVRLEGDPRIVREMARPLAGDRRAGFLSARAGRTAALRTAVARRLPRGSRIVAMREAVRAGLFGPPPFHPELSDRLGDLLVLVPSPAGITYLPPGAAEPRRYLVGAHGGLEAAEMIVPRVAGSLESFLPGELPAGQKR